MNFLNSKSKTPIPNAELDEEAAIRLAISLSLNESAAVPRSVANNGKQLSQSTDYAIAKSLQESLNDDKMHHNTTSDHELALKLQEEDRAALSKVNTPPKSSNSANEKLDNAHFNVPVNHCYVCQQAIGYEKFISALGVKYHSRCFNCDGCNQHIVGSFVPKLVPKTGGRPGTMQVSHAVPYHHQCVRELYSPRCCLCNVTIEGKYYHHPFFKSEEMGGGGYCIRHNDTQDHCSSCGRLEPLPEKRHTESFVAFPDNRRSCSECISTAILSSDEARVLYNEILAFMTKNLQLKLPKGMKDIPILAVDAHVLNQHITNQTTYSHGNIPMSSTSSSSSSNSRGTRQHSTTRGLTISTCGTVTHYNQWGGRPGPSSSTSASNNKSKYQFNAANFIITKPVFEEEVRTVTGILILVGLPRDLTASILAHEAMHAYCKLTTSMPFDLTPMIEEGMCQYNAYQYLEYVQQHHVPTANNKWNTLLINYYKYQIETNPTVEYGDGYRKINKCCTELGYEVVLEHIQAYKNFPDV